jgi:hypothetical protein
MTNKNILSSNISQSIIIKTTNNFYSNEIKTENKIEPQMFTNKNIFSVISQSIMKEINNNYYSNEITTKDKIITNINTFFIDNASSEFETELIIVGNNINILINHFNKTKIDEGIDMKLLQENIHYLMTSSKNQKNRENGNETNIDLKECEMKLKKVYNISEKEPLYIIKLILMKKNAHSKNRI